MPAPSKRSPCSSCPWRKDAKLGLWHDDHYREMADSCQRDGHSRMGCHKSTLENFTVCAGWVLVLGYNAIGVRLGHMQGKFDPENDFDAGGLGLYESWEEMAKANGVDTPDFRVSVGADWRQLTDEEREEHIKKKRKELLEMWGLNEEEETS